VLARVRRWLQSLASVELYGCVVEPDGAQTPLTVVLRLHGGPSSAVRMTGRLRRSQGCASSEVVGELSVLSLLSGDPAILLKGSTAEGATLTMSLERQPWARRSLRELTSYRGHLAVEGAPPRAVRLAHDLRHKPRQNGS
jgi:hypothetical protein